VEILHKLIILTLSISFLAKAEVPNCAAKTELRKLFVHDEHLERIANSPIVLNSIGDPNSVYHELFSVIKNYKKRLPNENRLLKENIDIDIADESIHIKANLYSENDALVVEIKSVMVGKLLYGQTSRGLNTAFYKFLGATTRGIDQNIKLFSGQFKAVQVIASDVVNLPLRNTLKQFGFKIIKYPNSCDLGSHYSDQRLTTEYFFKTINL
jgi:hypothetical protein